uniref:Putative secreted protein n=1 Tax=Ixodes ricinus TaxID=34613 RepID=A0A6B0UBR1_IXORI
MMWMARGMTPWVLKKSAMSRSVTVSGRPSMDTHVCARGTDPWPNGAGGIGLWWGASSSRVRGGTAGPSGLTPSALRARCIESRVPTVSSM